MQNGKIKLLKAANCLPQTNTSVVTQLADSETSHTSDLIKIHLPLCFTQARLIWEDYTELYWVFFQNQIIIMKL